MKHLNTALPGIVFLTSLIPASAWAVPAARPAQTEPGRIEQQLHIEEPRPELGGAPLILLPDENGQTKILKPGATFTLKSVTLQNQTVLSKEELEQDYASYIGKDITLANLHEIANKITSRYRNAGYILSRAIVPPQHIKNGDAKILIIEGYVNNVIFEGKGGDSPLLAAYADKIRAAKPLNSADLERYLLLIEDLPGVSARAVLRPAQFVPGATDVVITLTQKKIDGAVTLDNRGTLYLGPVQAGLMGAFSDAFGRYDRTQLRTVSTSHTKELEYFQLSHDEQIGSEGTKLTIAATRTRTHPSYRLESFDINGLDELYSGKITHPFLRSRQSNFFGSTQFDIRNTDSRALSGPLYADRLRIARIGASYDFVDRFSAVNRLETQVSKGFNWDNSASPDVHSRVNGRPDFWKATAIANRLQPISGPFSLYVAGTGQVSSSELLSAEQFGIGGADYGSAYDPSEITGDSGIIGRAELQFSQSGNLPVISSYQLYSFYDLGTVWTRNAPIGQKSQDSLADIGAGVRFNASAPLSGNLELAIPMTHPVSADNANGNGNDARLFFSLEGRF